MLMISVTVANCAVTEIEINIEWFMDNVEKRLILREKEKYPNISV